MMKPIRLLVLGTGGMANTHVMHFSTISEVQLVAAVDLDIATVRAFATAGKHGMCEKPLAENYAKADEMATAAEKSGLVNIVNLTYRNVAEVQKARQMVIGGEIGRVRHIEASYLQSWLVSKAWGDWATESQWLWRLSTKHGSNGVLGDIGIHILDFASYGAGLEIGHIFARLKTY